MSKLTAWCVVTKESINGHDLCLLDAHAAKLNLGVSTVAKIVPDHYATKTRVAALLKRLGKEKAAEYVQEKLPKTKAIRSGDLGEILAAAYVAQSTAFSVAINKLRWKDHRDMAMRGDDLIAFEQQPGARRIRFLKGEVKSAAQLKTATVMAARGALRKSRSRPSPHALAFIADRLHDDGDDALADLIDDAILRDGIALDQMTHLIFTFSGNDPVNLLRASLKAYKGKVPQITVGLRVPSHQKFISDVFARVMANANGK